ncbi:MAG: tetratricopeptide repeat protein [Acidobacteriota bacterium]|nr:tetratricopeptide repeat protein [Acidobacteriota bacterium]
MKTCPRCQSDFADDYVFCMNDGTPLIESESEEQTLVSAKNVSFPATTALSPDMLNICPQCSLQNRKQSKFCKKCGAVLPSSLSSSEREASHGLLSTVNSNHAESHAPFVSQNRVSPLFTAAPPPSAGHQTANASAETIVFQVPKITPHSGIAGQSDIYRQQQQQQTTGKKSDYLRNWLIGIGSLILLAAAGLGIWYWTQPNPLELKLDAAIKNKQIIAPAGANAFDFYHQLKIEGASSAALKKYEDRVFPFLTEKIDDVLKTVSEPGYTEGRIETWQEEVKKLEWASKIQPDDKNLAAKLAYCKGRVAYLTDNKNAALEEWKRAADLDAKWALPLNAVGLIYNEKKDYETARKWFDKAIEIEPRWAIPYNNYGTSFYYQNRFDEAESYYRKAIEFSPRWARPRAWLASIAERRYDYQTAVAEYEQVFAANAVGTEGMDMESIRRKYEKAKTNSYSYYSY